MDASSSAYQIMSDSLLDEDLAQRTNLIGGDGDTIQDLYTSLISPLSAYLKEELKPPLGEVIPTRITRELIKRVYMPLVYGKGLMSSAQDISAAMYDILKTNENIIVSAAFYRFWFEKYPQIKNLMNLINLGGWFAATLNLPVSYHTHYFQSIQDYMKTESVIVWVFDRIKKKRRKISLSMPSTTRDRVKTQRSCFANFIHQKDASIALYIMDHFTNSNLYTVHDNFIVNPTQVSNITHCYTSAFQSLGDPLSQVNLFLFNNILVHTSFCSELSSQELTSYLTSLHHIEKPTYTNQSCAESLLNVLERALTDLVPAGLKRKDHAIWDNKKKMLLESYRKYVRSLDYQGEEYVGYAFQYHTFLEKLHHKDSRRFALHP
jgi:DNA-directed RNA polymerase